MLIRAFEEYVLELAAAGLVHGPAHSSIGQEGGAVGSVLALTAEDKVNGSHRGHHQFLAKALHHVAPKGFDLDRASCPTRSARCCCARSPRSAGSPAATATAAAARCTCSGRRPARWAPTPSSAAACRRRPASPGPHRQAGTDAVAVTYFGDGAANIGSTLETFNLAAAWQLPVCFFVENNQYAVSTSVAEATGEPRLSARGPGFGIASWRVDGMDPLAVHLAMREAVAHMRAGHGPTLVEADTYRYFHQNGPFPGSAFRYRGKDEEAAWRERDPIDQVARPPGPPRPADPATASSGRSRRPSG